MRSTTAAGTGRASCWAKIEEMLIVFSFLYGKRHAFCICRPCIYAWWFWGQPHMKQSVALNTDKVNRCLARYSPCHNHQPTHQQGTKWASNGQKCQFRLNLVVLGQKILFFTREIKSFFTHITKKPPRHLVHIVFWSGIGQNVQKMAIFGPKWPKMQILDQIWPFLGQKA